MNPLFLLHITTSYGSFERHYTSDNMLSLIEEAYSFLFSARRDLKSGEEFQAHIYSTSDLENRATYIPVLWKCYFKQSHYRSADMVKRVTEDGMPKQKDIESACIVEDYLL